MKTAARRQQFAMVVLAAVGLWLLRPFQNLPFVDDWVYAWPVEHLWKTGQLRVLEYSSAVNVPQVLWGWLFTAVGGFSFSALRVSTFVLAVLGLWILHRLLRELSATSAAAKLGVATLAVYPIYFVLTFSFMTDVPFVTCLLAATYEFVIAMKYQRTWRLVSCAVLIAVSMTLRFNGFAMAGAMGLVLLLYGGSWGRRWRFLLALIPLIAMPMLIAWDQTHKVCPADLLKVQNSPPGREVAIGYALPLLPKMLPATLAYLAGDVGLALLPITLAVMRRRYLASAAMILLVIAGGCVALRYAGIDFPLPLQDRQTWALTELGAMQPLVPGHTPFAAPSAVYWSLAALGWASTALLLATQFRKHSAVEWFLIWSAVFTIVLMGALWLIHDRYVLPIAVTLAILVLAGAERVRIWRAMPVLVLFGAICIVGTHDQQRYNRALWTAVARLRQDGAKDSQIIGGYTVNGWLQYAHPANAPVAYGFVVVPWVTGDYWLRYEIRNAPPISGQVIGVQSYRRWMRSSGELYLVDHQPPEQEESQVAKSSLD